MKAKQIILLFLFVMKMNSTFSQTLFAKKIEGMNAAIGMVVGPDSVYNIISHAAEFIKIDKFGTTLVQSSYLNSCFPDPATFNLINSVDSGFIISGYTSGAVQPHRPFIAKTNSGGEIQWFRTTNEFNNFYGFNTIQLKDGSLISSTIFNDSLSGIDQIYFQKTDIFGNLQWAKTFQNQIDCYLYSFCPTADNGFIITGQKGLYPFYSKFDSLGVVSWSKSFPSLYSSGNSVAVLSDNNFIILGQSGSYPNAKIFLAKVDTLGNLLWYKLYDRTLLNNGYKIIERKNGDFVIVGCVDNSNKGFLMVTNSQGIPKFSKKYVINPVYPYTTFRDVFESNDNSLTLLANGQIDSLSVNDVLIKLDSIGEGFCNVYNDTVPFSSLSYATITDITLVFPFVATTTAINCFSSLSLGTSSNICINNEISFLEVKKLLVYPNPIKDYLLISPPIDFYPNSIEVYNSLGQKVLFRELFDSQQHELNVPISLTPGIYYGRLFSRQEVVSFNFVVSP